MTDIKRIAARGIAGLCWLVMVCGGAWAQPSVWTHRYDNARSGVNVGEVQLNTSNVNPGQFGKLFSYGVDADIYTQPLVIANVAVAGKGTHNVVFVATNNNSVYAFDADTNRSGNDLPLWHVNFNGPGVTPIPATDVQTLNSIRTPGPIGIMGTPVIDQATGTLYVVARTKETAGASVTYVQRLHALDIRSGAEKFGGPVMITAAVAGTGYDNAGGVVTFNARTANQRPGLALANGNVYIAWSSYGDGGFYHGWVMAYSASTLQQVGVFCITPDGSRAGIWQSGQPPSIDASGNLYLATGNGTFDGVRNFGQTILKLNPNLSTVLDWFTPGNWDSLNRSDRDLGSSGVLLVPGTNVVIGAGKDGLFYVLDRNNLGHSQSGNGQILQSFRVASGNVHGGPIYWNGSAGPRVFVWGEDDYLKSFAVSGALLNTTPVSKSPYAAPPGMPGGFLTVSSNGTQAGSGVLWATLPYAEDANEEVVSGVLRAFDATDLSRELWNTRMVPARDDIGNFAKYVPPTVVNGRVYMSSLLQPAQRVRTPRLDPCGERRIDHRRRRAFLCRGRPHGRGNDRLGGVAAIRGQVDRQQPDQRLWLPRRVGGDVRRRSADVHLERRRVEPLLRVGERRLRGRAQQWLPADGAGEYDRTYAAALPRGKQLAGHAHGAAVRWLSAAIRRYRILEHRAVRRGLYVELFRRGLGRAANGDLEPVFRSRQRHVAGRCAQRTGGPAVSDRMHLGGRCDAPECHPDELRRGQLDVGRQQPDAVLARACAPVRHRGRHASASVLQCDDEDAGRHRR